MTKICCWDSTLHFASQMCCVDSDIFHMKNIDIFLLRLYSNRNIPTISYCLSLSMPLTALALYPLYG